MSAKVYNGIRKVGLGRVIRGEKLIEKIGRSRSDTVKKYQARDNNRGGNAEFRSKEVFKQSVDTLLKKWGKYLKMKMHQGQIGLSIQVKRKAVINES